MIDRVWANQEQAIDAMEFIGCGLIGLAKILRRRERPEYTDELTNGTPVKGGA